MSILNFNQFKLLLEADEVPPVSGAAPTDQPSPDVAGAQSAPTTDAGGTTSFTPPPPSFSPEPISELPPDPNAPAATPEPKTNRFVFASDSKDWHLEYSEGGGVKRYTEYELMPGELDQWITSSGLDANRNEILNAVNVGTPLAKDLYEKLRTAVKEKKLAKDRGIIDIEEDASGKTSTNDLEIILLRSK